MIREKIEAVNPESLGEQIATAQLDLLLATTRAEYLRVADHLRLLANQVESFVEKMP